MKKFDSILAFGDSFVSGYELVDENIESWLPKKYTSVIELDYVTKKLSFPQRLGDRMGVPVYNYAMTGGSNPRSMRIFFDVCQRRQNALILFAYTELNRWEFYDHSLTAKKFQYLNQDDNNFMQVITGWEGNIDVHPNTQNYLKYCGDASHNLPQMMFFVESASKTLGFECIHLLLFPGCFDFNNPKYTPRHLFGFQGQENFTNWCEAKKYPKLPKHHYGIPAHADLADLLFDYVNDNF